MTIMHKVIETTMTLAIATVHRMLSRCGHRTQTSLWAVMATSVQADRTPETYKVKKYILHTTLFCAAIIKIKNICNPGNTTVAV